MRRGNRLGRLHAYGRHILGVDLRQHLPLFVALGEHEEQTNVRQIGCQCLLRASNSAPKQREGNQISKLITSLSLIFFFVASEQA